MFVEVTMMIAVTCAAINIYQVHIDKIDPNASHTLAICFTIFLPAYSIGLFIYLCKNMGKMETQQMKERVGYAYSSYGIKERQKKYAVTLLIMRQLRIMALAFVITFSSKNLMAQSIYVAYSSLLLIAIMGLSRPFEEPSTTRLELANEFTILVLLSFLLC